MRVWETRSLITKNARLRLHRTRAEAEYYVGTEHRHLYEFVEVEADVVFLLVNGGWYDEGGGTVAGVYATYEAAARHLDKGREQEVEIWKVEQS